MKMSLSLLLIFLAMVAAASFIAYLWLCNDLQLDPKTGRKIATRPTAEIVQEKRALYAVYRVDYEQFGALLWAYIDTFAGTLRLESPKSPLGIYCQERVDQIGNINGTCTFRYEVPKIISGLPKHSDDFKAKMEWLSEIQKSIRGHLPDYMRDGYRFSGQVSVWDIGNNRIRIEIHGVDRRFTATEEIRI